MDDALVEDLESRVKAMMSAFNTDLSKVKDILGNSTSTANLDPVVCTSLHRCLEVLDSSFSLFRNAITEELGRMKAGLSRLDERQDDLEQYSRRNCLLLLGVPETDSTEDEAGTEKAALDVFVKKLDVSINAGDIERTHRLGTRKSGRNRPIIIKFWSYKSRAKIFTAKSKLKDSPLRIAESLTRKRMGLLNAARDRFGVKRCWTSDGKIFINLSSSDGSSKRQVVTSMQMLQDIKDPTPSQTAPRNPKDPKPSQTAPPVGTAPPRTTRSHSQSKPVKKS